MILENKWYELNRSKQRVLEDSAGRTKEKTTYFPKMVIDLKMA